MSGGVENDSGERDGAGELDAVVFDLAEARGLDPHEVAARARSLQQLLTRAAEEGRDLIL